MKKIFFTAFTLVLADQLLKFWIKTNMILGQEFVLFDWFIIHFTENNGMAFGLEFGGSIGKVLLTLFRIIIVTLGVYYLRIIVSTKFRGGALIASGLILGGAIGNIIDSTFYGMIFNESYNNIASIFLPPADTLLCCMGKVVDMFYLPLINSHFPNWVPFLAAIILYFLGQYLILRTREFQQVLCLFCFFIEKNLARLF